MLRLDSMYEWLGDVYINSNENCPRYLPHPSELCLVKRL